MKTVTVYTIPGALKNNPYLELLIGGVEGTGVGEFQFVSKPFSTRALCARVLSGKPSIVHIHWETNIYGSKYWLYSVFKILTRFPLLYIARWCGVKFVWTMHNFHAHEFPFQKLDAYGQQLMRGLAHAVIIQNRGACTMLSQTYPRTRFVYIPHGNYVHAYEERHADSSSPDRDAVRMEIRNEWQVSEKSIVLLALGAIRPYKQLELLVSQVIRASHTSTEGDDVSPLVLVIAGKGEKEYVHKLQQLAGNSAAIKIIPTFVPDARVPEFLAAADYAVFSYGESSLTSGALLLALSFKTPVITLAMPAAEIVTEGVNGYVRKSPEELGELFETLSSMTKLDPERGLESVADLSWERVGKETAELYASLYN